jgi:hypothetical protein
LGEFWSYGRRNLLVGAGEAFFQIWRNGYFPQRKFNMIVHGCSLKRGDCVSVQKKRRSLKRPVLEKVCLVDAFVYGLSAKALISRFFARFLLNSGVTSFDC